MANSSSFRQNYGEFGVDGYYDQFGDQYTNPREEEVSTAISKALILWTTNFGLTFGYVKKTRKNQKSSLG